MEFAEVYSMTNSHGRKFLDMWFRNYEFLGVEITPSNVSRNEFTLVFRDTDGEIRAAILPDSKKNDDGTCFYGDLKRFSMIYAEEKSGVKLRMNMNNCQLIWPVWYTNETDFLRWKVFYDEMMKKYS